MGVKTILHLCADIGSDSRFYQIDENYNVILVGEDIGVENFIPPKNIHGIIANPVCTEFSIANGYHKDGDYQKGMEMVDHCIRIINQSNPKWWVIENPATGRLKRFLGEPQATYQPWEYGSPWTKKTGLWGNFILPPKLYNKWEDVPKIDNLYIKPGRKKPSLVHLHKSAIDLIPEFEVFKPNILSDADFRSLCSQGFAEQFYKYNT